MTSKTITLKNTPYVRMCRVKKLCIMEITDELKEHISDIENINTLNIKCGLAEYIELTQQFGIEDKPITYNIEVEGVEKEVLIGVVKEDEEGEGKMNRVKIIYARCEKSMKLLEKRIGMRIN